MTPRFVPLRLRAVAFCAVLLSASVSAQPRTAPVSSELPPMIRDPIPGPFIVGFDVDGNLVGDADDVIANAARSWMLDTLDAYTICY